MLIKKIYSSWKNAMITKRQSSTFCSLEDNNNRGNTEKTENVFKARWEMKLDSQKMNILRCCENSWKYRRQKSSFHKRQF